jgi:hypothetical protein
VTVLYALVLSCPVGCVPWGCGGVGGGVWLLVLFVLIVLCVLFVACTRLIGGCVLFVLCGLVVCIASLLRFRFRCPPVGGVGWGGGGWWCV